MARARRRRPGSDLPFAGDPATRFLPGVIALMIFLAALALAGALLLERAVADWRQSLTARLTVEVPAGPLLDERLRAAEAELRATAGIASVRVLSEAEVAALLRPWLGDAAGALALPLPRLIDARPASAALDLDGLRARLGKSSPPAVLDDHGDFLSGLVALARALEWLALTVVVLVGAAAVTAIAFVVKSGLAIHRDVVEFLHLIGATDAYIGRQFERQILRQGLRGALLGSLAVAGVAVAIAALARALESPALRIPGLDWTHWTLVAQVPLWAMAAAGFTARRTVRRALAALP